MSTATQNATSLDSIESMLQEIHLKQAEANTEAGGYDGATEHQSKSEDDSTEDAREGSRSSENESDVKEDQGAAGVDGKDVNAAAKSALELPGNQDAVQMDIGVTSKATGEDSKNETSRAKDTKEDSADGGGGPQGRGQTSHPARTSNNEIDGHKWSSEINETFALIKQATDLGNEALAALSVEADETIKKQAGAASQALGGDPNINVNVGEPTGKQAAAPPTPQGQVPSSDKEAQDRQVVADLAQTLMAAYAAADKTAAFVHGVAEQKRAEEEASDEGGEEAARENPSEEGGEGGSAPPEELGEGGGGGMPPEAGGGETPPEAGGGGGAEDALMQALMGGGGEAPPDAGGGMPGMGGPPPEAGGMPGMGGPPEGGGMPGMGGPPPEMGGGMPGMGGPPEGGGMGGQIGPEELQMLLAALQEAGIDPAALEAGATAKAAQALKQKQASGELQRTEWRPKTAEEAQRYQAVLNYVQEIAGAKK
jgi:hypothetical protein